MSCSKNSSIDAKVSRKSRIFEFRFGSRMYVFCGLIHPPDTAQGCDSGFSDFFIFFHEFFWEGFHISHKKCRISLISGISDAFKGPVHVVYLPVVIILAPEESWMSILSPNNHFVIHSKPWSQRKYLLKSITKVRRGNVTIEWFCLCWAYVNLFSQHFVKKKSTSRCRMALIF